MKELIHIYIYEENLLYISKNSIFIKQNNTFSNKYISIYNNNNIKLAQGQSGENHITRNFIKENRELVCQTRDKDEKLENLMKRTREFLKKPILRGMERKLALRNAEMYWETSFFSADVACLYLNVMPIEGPFIVIPCLEKKYLIFNVVMCQ